MVINARSLVAQTEIICENAWRDPAAAPEAEAATSIFAQAGLLKAVPHPAISLQSVNERMLVTAKGSFDVSRTWAYDKQNDIEEIKLCDILLVAGSEHTCQALIYEDTLNVSCVLTVQ